MGDARTLEEAFRKWSSDLNAFATMLAGPSGAGDVVADVFVALLERGEPFWQRVDDQRPYLFRSVLNAVRMRERSTLAGTAGRRSGSCRSRRRS